MEIVRKKLTPDDLSPPYLRYNPDDDVVQVSGDNGATWQDAPQLDPRTTNQFAPLTTGDPQCDGAIRMVAAIEEVVMALINAINGGAQYAALQGILMGWLAVFGFFFVLVALAALVLALFVAIGYAALYSAFSMFDWDELACKVRCSVDSQGRLDATSLQEVKDMIAADYDSTQSAILNAILDLTGFGALNAFAATRSETGDCSGCDECEWCWYYDAAALNAGNDWTHSSDFSYSQVYEASPGGSYDIFYARLEYTWNGVDGGSGSGMVIRDGVTNLATQIPLTGGTGVIEYDGADIAIDDWLIGGNTATSGGGGVVAITSFTIRGRGALPAFNDGVEC